MILVIEKKDYEEDFQPTKLFIDIPCICQGAADHTNYSYEWKTWIYLEV